MSSPDESADTAEDRQASQPKAGRDGSLVDRLRPENHTFRSCTPDCPDARTLGSGPHCYYCGSPPQAHTRNEKERC